MPLPRAPFMVRKVGELKHFCLSSRAIFVFFSLFSFLFFSFFSSNLTSPLRDTRCLTNWSYMLIVCEKTLTPGGYGNGSHFLRLYQQVQMFPEKSPCNMLQHRSRRLSELSPLKTCFTLIFMGCRLWD